MKPVLVTAMGMVSSLGPSAVGACAAARAGISRAAELEALNFAGDEAWGEGPVVGHAALPAGSVGVARARKLASGALEDLLATRDLRQERTDRTSLHLCLADLFLEDKAASREREGEPTDGPDGTLPQPSEEWAAGAPSLMRSVLESTGLDLREANLRWKCKGHVGVAQAVQEAADLIQAGQADRALIGAVESCIEPRPLQAALTMGAVRTQENPVGFIPGEAGAFFLLESVDTVARRGEKGILQIEGVSWTETGVDRFDDAESGGYRFVEALSSVLGQVSGGEPPHLVVGDLNGEVHRANAWGHALMRVGDPAILGNAPLWAPALSFGETGAAVGGVGVCMLAQGYRRGHAPGSRSLIWLVGDRGGVGAISLSSPAT